MLKLDALAPADFWDDAARRMLEAGMPLVDDFRMTPSVPTEQSDLAYRELVETLPDGLTFVALHPNAPGDIETIVPLRAHFRTDEHRIFRSGRFTEWSEAGQVQLLGMRPLHDLMRGLVPRFPKSPD